MDLLLKGDSRRGTEIVSAKVLAAEPRNADCSPWDLAECTARRATPEAGAEHLVRVIDEEVGAGEHRARARHWRELVVTAHETGPAALRWRLAGSLATGVGQPGVGRDPTATSRAIRPPDCLPRRLPDSSRRSARPALPSAPPPPAAFGSTSKAGLAAGPACLHCLRRRSRSRVCPATSPPAILGGSSARLAVGRRNAGSEDRDLRGGSAPAGWPPPARCRGRFGPASVCGGREARGRRDRGQTKPVPGPRPPPSAIRRAAQTRGTPPQHGVRPSAPGRTGWT